MQPSLFATGIGCVASVVLPREPKFMRVPRPFVAAQAVLSCRMLVSPIRSCLASVMLARNLRSSICTAQSSRHTGVVRPFSPARSYERTTLSPCAHCHVRTQPLHSCPKTSLVHGACICKYTRVCAVEGLRIAVAYDISCFLGS